MMRATTAVGLLLGLGLAAAGCTLGEDSRAVPNGSNVNSGNGNPTQVDAGYGARPVVSEAGVTESGPCCQGKGCGGKGKGKGCKGCKGAVCGEAGVTVDASGGWWPERDGGGWGGYEEAGVTVDASGWWPERDAGGGWGGYEEAGVRVEAGGGWWPERDASGWGGYEEAGVMVDAGGGWGGYEEAGVRVDAGGGWRGRYEEAGAGRWWRPDGALPGRPYPPKKKHHP